MHPTASPQPEARSRGNTALWLALLVAGVAGFWYVLGLRVAYPFIFGDETTFMQQARACRGPEGSPAAALHSLSPLHSLLYAGACEPGPNWVARVRLLNALLCGLSVVPAWLLARRFLSGRWPLVFALVVGLNPWNSFTANFMPESLYGFVFWWLAWAVVAPSTRARAGWVGRLAWAAGAGVLAALLFFTKSHALTLVLVCTLVYATRALRAARANAPGTDRPLLEGAGFLVAWFTCLAAFALAADRSVTDLFYAGRYQGEAGGLLQVHDTAAMLRCFGRQIAGTLAHAAVLYGVPIGVALAAIPRLWRRSEPQSEPLATLVSFSVLALGLTLFFSIKFISDQELGAQPLLGRRLMERYYGHLLPLLVLVYLAVRAAHPHPARAARVLVAVIACIAAVVLAGWSGTFTLAAYDTPSFYWINPFEAEPRVLPGWALGAILALAAVPPLWFASGRQRHAAVFLIVFLPLSALAIAGTHRQFVRESRGLSQFHEYAALTRHINSGEWDRTVLIGDGFRVMAYQMMLEGRPRVVVVDEGGTLEASTLPADVRWLIRLNTEQPKDGPEERVAFRGWAHGTVVISRVAE